MEFLCGQDGVGEELKWAELGASVILAAEVSNVRNQAHRPKMLFTTNSYLLIQFALSLCIAKYQNIIWFKPCMPITDIQSCSPRSTFSNPTSRSYDSMSAILCPPRPLPPDSLGSPTAPVSKQSLVHLFDPAYLANRAILP